MGQHLYSFRQGWQSEALSRFLLSHFSFIAQPSTIADDVGSDFYCTLFKKERAGSNSRLIPNSSFLIQIKSSDDVIDLSDKVRFLEQLELPFFVGVANRRALKLQIYSGRALQLIFTLHGNPEKLLVKLVPKILDQKYYTIENREKAHLTVAFPLHVEIEAASVEKEAGNIFSAISDENSLIHQNIASRRMKEFVLKFSEDDVRIFAGPASAQVFRRNFMHRLAEVFYNFKWIIENSSIKFPLEEYQIYADFWEKIRDRIQEPTRKEIDGLCALIKKKAIQPSA